MYSLVGHREINYMLIFVEGGKPENNLGGGVGVKGHPFIQPLGTMLPFHWNNQDTNSTYSSQRSGHRVSGFVV